MQATAKGIEGAREAARRPGAAAAAALGAVLLGVLSRVEETSELSLGISTDAAWVALAFVAGAVLRGRTAARAALCGALVLTLANLAYYAWIAAEEPGVDLTAVAGPPLRWLILGVAGGALFAVAGRWWSGSSGVPRVLASLPLAGVCIADGITALDGGPPAAASPSRSARRCRLRRRHRRARGCSAPRCRRR